MPINVTAIPDFRVLLDKVNELRDDEVGPPYIESLWGERQDVRRFHTRIPNPTYNAHGGYTMPSSNLTGTAKIRGGTVFVRWSTGSTSAVYQVDRSSPLLVTDFEVTEV